MSMHNHYTGNSASQLQLFDRIGLEDPLIGQPYPRLPASPAEFFRLWISTSTVPRQTDGWPSTSFFDLEASYWAERHRTNFPLVHSNDLKSDLDGEMRRIASFLNIPVDAAVWPALVAAASFEAMRAAGDSLMPHTRTMLVEGPQRFFNKGFNGRWRDVLTDDDLALYDAKVRTKLTPGLAAWLACGRLASSDPRTAPD